VTVCGFDLQSQAHPLAQLPEFLETLLQRRFTGLRPESFVIVSPSLDLGVHLRLVIVIVRKRRVNLREREVRVLKMHLLGARSMRKFVEDNFDDFDVRLVDPGHTPVVQPDMRCGFSRHFCGRAYL